MSIMSRFLSMFALAAPLAKRKNPSDVEVRQPHDDGIRGKWAVADMQFLRRGDRNPNGRAATRRRRQQFLRLGNRNPNGRAETRQRHTSRGDAL